jgi:hypothetical protein
LILKAEGAHASRSSISRACKPSGRTFARTAYNNFV